MMFARKVTIGHMPMTLFGLMVVVVTLICSTHLLNVTQYPPTLVVPEASGLVTVQPAGYDAKYNEVIGRRFLNIIGNYNPANYDDKVLWGSLLCSKPYAEGSYTQAMAALKKSVESFRLSVQTTVLKSKIVWEDPADGVTIIRYLAEITEFYHAAQAPNTRRVMYQLEVQAVDPEEGSMYASQIVGGSVVTLKQPQESSS